jgi:hypothetical protein
MPTRSGLTRGALAVCVALYSVSTLGADPAVGAKAAPTLEQLEAALLITFANYTVWPASALPAAAAPIVVGVVGDQALADTFQEVSRERRVGGRPLATKVLQWESDLSGVHVLFMGQIERRHVTALLAQAQHKPILTVSMAREFAPAGGMISLTYAGGRVIFAVNSKATQLAGLQLSSFVLSYATSVKSQ